MVQLFSTLIIVEVFLQCAEGERKRGVFAIYCHLGDFLKHAATIF